MTKANTHQKPALVPEARRIKINERQWPGVCRAFTAIDASVCADVSDDAWDISKEWEPLLPVIDAALGALSGMDLKVLCTHEAAKRARITKRHYALVRAEELITAYHNDTH